MRYCLRCDHPFVSDVWPCPACGHSPERIEEFWAFAPELARENSDYNPDFFRVLVDLEDKSFWFRARNRLILWSVSRFFPDARSVLEIGVGTGFVTRALRTALPQAEMWGSDIHVEGLRFAAGRLQDSATLFQMDACRIPFRAEFDLVGLFDVLEHIEDDEAVLREIGRALKPGGGILLAVPQHMSLWGPADDLARHKRRYAAGELARKVREAGFDVILKTSFVSLLLPVLYASRLRSRRTRTYDLLAELRIHPALNLLFLSRAQRGATLIRSGLRLPAGGSQFLVARRPA